MSVTLFDGVSTTLTLPNDILWEDEHSWYGVVHESGYTLTGALVVEVSQKLAGKPVTLRSRPNMSWIPKATFDVLKAWAETPGKQLTLTIRGVSHTVIFDHSNTAIESEVVGYYRDTQDPKWYIVTMRFIII